MKDNIHIIKEYTLAGASIVMYFGILLEILRYSDRLELERRGQIRVAGYLGKKKWEKRV